MQVSFRFMNRSVTLGLYPSVKLWARICVQLEGGCPLYFYVKQNPVFFNERSSYWNTLMLSGCLLLLISTHTCMDQVQWSLPSSAPLQVNWQSTLPALLKLNIKWKRWSGKNCWNFIYFFWCYYLSSTFLIISYFHTFLVWGFFLYARERQRPYP